jgi:hypothetical protein
MYTECDRVIVRRALAKIQFRQAKRVNHPNVEVEEHCAQPISPSKQRLLPSMPPCSLGVVIGDLPTRSLGLIFAL